MKTTTIRLLLAISILWAAVPLANAGSLQAGVSNDALNMNVSMNLIGPLSAEASYLHNYRNDNDLATAGLRLDFGLGPVSAMAGIRYFYTNVSGQDGDGIAPGVGISFSPLPLFTLSGQYYYSNPDYSNGDIEHYRDWSVTANFHPTGMTNFYAGYGEQVIDSRKYGNTDVYNGVFGGVTVSF